MRNILLATTAILILGIAMAVFSSSLFTATVFASSSLLIIHPLLKIQTQPCQDLFFIPLQHYLL
jgi:hypothetical protein